MLGALARQNLQRENMQLIEEYSEALKNYKTIFKVFEDIKKGDKIGKSGENYHIFPGNFIQRITRFIYSENRKTTFTYIDNDFKEFFSLCDRIKESHSALTPNAHIKKALVEIINIVIPGLYNLKHAYENDDDDDDARKLCCKIDSIILTLIDIKNEINQKKSPQTSSMVPIVLQSGRNIPVYVAAAHSY